MRQAQMRDEAWEEGPIGRMVEAFDLDCVVIGAGVVGLAIARELALAGREVAVIEAEPLIGSITSSRNSEVIHAGLYYPTGSLKAALCVAGKHRLYHYCRERQIAHRACGKLVVASSSDEVAYLENLLGQAHANGVDDCRLIDAAELARMEPEIRGHAALLSPSTGIIDSHGLMAAFEADILDRDGMIVLNAPVTGGEVGEGGTVRLSVGGAEPSIIDARLVVNAAGLGAWGVSQSIAGLNAAAIPERHYAKGCYFSLTGRAPASHLIYPVPEKGGLGVHLTLDLAGQGRFGPDVEWVETIDYDVDPRRADRFYAAIRRYWPDLPDGALQPAYAGMRPKLAGPDGTGSGDFLIHGPAETGHPGFVALYGIESPGLTASMAIAERIRDLVSA
jgi:L-2-hydroxyglutarate oxidase LhgO